MFFIPVETREGYISLFSSCNVVISCNNCNPEPLLSFRVSYFFTTATTVCFYTTIIAKSPNPNLTPPPNKEKIHFSKHPSSTPQNQKTKISIFTRSCLLRFEILPAQHLGFQHFQYCHGEFHRYRRTGLRLTLRRAGAYGIAAWRQHGGSGSGAEESTGSDGRGSLRLKPLQRDDGGVDGL